MPPPPFCQNNTRWCPSEFGSSRKGGGGVAQASRHFMQHCSRSPQKLQTKTIILPLFAQASPKDLKFFWKMVVSPLCGTPDHTNGTMCATTAPPLHPMSPGTDANYERTPRSPGEMGLHTIYSSNSDSSTLNENNALVRTTVPTPPLAIPPPPGRPSLPCFSS